ncbi:MULTISPECIES: hypothetical protein [unclassified Anabaena]|uniref:hypothetical protein n=1 Tax=unclassified Anabaena TaxID=2619674 RepID=UPI0008299984|nr:MULTISPECIES: hypothetical protein [unclassified Anabaena]
MSQGVHFARLKYFSEEFTKTIKHDEVLQELKKILEKEEKVDETLESKFIENIETKFPSLNAYGEIEKFLGKNSKIILHPKSRFYFVNEEIWEVIQEEYFQRSKQIDKKKDFSEIAEDYITIKKYFDNKMLVFDAS